MKIEMLCESVEIDDIKNQPYFDRFPEVLLYRGIRKNYDDIVELPFQFRTKPLDTASFIHDAINDVSQKIFNLPIRNLIFSYTVIEGTEGYGHPAIIVPKGDDFKLFYNPEVEDLTAYEGLKADMIYERMWDSALQDFINMDYGNEIVGDYWELEEAIQLAIEDVTFETTDMLKELYNHLSKTLASFLQLVAKKHDTDNERLDELHDAISNLDVATEVTQKFKELFEDFIERIASDYVDGVEEVDSEDDMDLSNNPEIMIYAPDGFFVVPVEMMD